MPFLGLSFDPPAPHQKKSFAHTKKHGERVRGHYTSLKLAMSKKEFTTSTIS